MINLWSDQLINPNSCYVVQGESPVCMEANMLNLKSLFKSGAYVLVLAVISLNGVANGATDSLRVNLIATIDNGPAMEDVTWRLYRNGTEEVKRASNHSTHVKIPPGKYTAVARLTSDDKTIVRTRNFLHTRNNTLVVVPMDDQAQVKIESV